MARRLVYYCITALTATAVWAAALKTLGTIREQAVDLSDILTFVGAAFGGELLLLLIKRVFAKEKMKTEQENETWNN